MINKKRATLADVAREAGVSKQTASRVINESKSVADETRQRVQAAIDRLGFRPSTVARNLTSGRSYTIGVVSPGFLFVSTDMYLGITREAEALGYTLVLKRLSDSSPENVRKILHELLDLQVDGILWAVPERFSTRASMQDDFYATLPVPMVFLSNRKRRNMHVVGFDNREGARLATQHLINIGRKRIAHISGPQDWWTAKERVEGWRGALHAAGLDSDDELLVEGTWRANSGEIAFGQLLDRDVGVDGLFAGNDRMALGALLTAHRRGLRVPEDVAVVGFDNLPESACYYPPLTSVLQDKELLGELGMRKLVGLIDASLEPGKKSVVPNVVLSHMLVLRESAPAKDSK